jgi:hypothetical protein
MRYHLEGEGILFWNRNRRPIFPMWWGGQPNSLWSAPLGYKLRDRIERDLT